MGPRGAARRAPRGGARRLHGPPAARAEGRAIPARLRRLARGAHPDTRWEAMGFGISGSCAGQELVLHREVVRRDRPDLVLLGLCIQDGLGDDRREPTAGRRTCLDLDGVGRPVQRPSRRALAGGVSGRLGRDLPDRRLAAAAASLGVPIVLLTLDFRRAAPHGSLAHPEEWLHLDGRGHRDAPGDGRAARGTSERLDRDGARAALAGERATAAGP